MESSEPVVAVGESEFKQALSRFASGVTIVTTEHDGRWNGMTVSAFCSVSLEPPLVLVCIEKNVRAHDMIRQGERFAVNILRDDQEDLSARFASKSDDKFEGISVTKGQLGLPLLDDALASLECRLRETLPGGDHTIYVGEVVRTRVDEGQPLIYFRGDYRGLSHP